jgi:hypothetical protein
MARHLPKSGAEGGGERRAEAESSEWRLESTDFAGCDVVTVPDVTAARSFDAARCEGSGRGRVCGC